MIEMKVSRGREDRGRDERDDQLEFISGLRAEAEAGNVPGRAFKANLSSPKMATDVNARDGVKGRPR
jgi:hypothetical protein